MVGTPRFQYQLNEGAIPVLSHYLVVGSCLPSTKDNCHSFSVPRISGDGSIYRPFFLQRYSDGKGHVTLMDLPSPDLLGEIMMSLLCLGDDQQARGVFIKSVDNSRSCNSANPFDVRATGQEGVHQCAIRVAWPGMHGKAGRLVYDRELRILVDNVQGNFLGNQVRYSYRRNGQLYAVASFDLLRWAGSYTVKANHAFRDKRVDATASQTFFLARKKPVKP